MRITSDFDLRNLGPSARKQVESAMKGKPISSQKRLTQAPIMNSKGKLKAPTPYKNNPPAKSSIVQSAIKNKPARIKTDAETGLKFCPYPSTDPAVWLHVALEKRFGSYWSGGDIVSEMIIPGHEVAFRYDFALLSAKVVIEFDGWAFHSKKDAFKRDREKHRHALLKGWVTLPITNAMVRNELDSIIEDIETLKRIRPQYDIPVISQKGNTQCIYPY